MDIKLLGNYLYYTAWNNEYITKLHKTNRNDTARLAHNPELGRLDSIVLYSSSLQPANVQTRCSSNSGRGECSTFCHPTPNGYTCGCPDGEQLLPDGKTCPTAFKTTPITTRTSISTNTESVSTSSPFTTPKYPLSSPSLSPPQYPASSTRTIKTIASSSITTTTIQKSHTRYTTHGIKANEDDNDSSSNSQIVYTGTGAAGTIVFVIVVVAVVILYKRCGRKSQNGARYVQTSQTGHSNEGFDTDAAYHPEAVTFLRLHGTYKTPCSAILSRNENTYNSLGVCDSSTYDTIDNVTNPDYLTMEAPPPPCLQNIPHSSELSGVYLTPSDARSSVAEPSGRWSDSGSSTNSHDSQTQLRSDTIEKRATDVRRLHVAHTVTARCLYEQLKFFTKCVCLAVSKSCSWSEDLSSQLVVTEDLFGGGGILIMSYI